MQMLLQWSRDLEKSRKLLDTRSVRTVSSLVLLVSASRIRTKGEHQMDQAILQAYQKLNSTRIVSADDILIEPDLRFQFLALVRKATGPIEEPTALRRLLTLPKTKKLPKSW